ncbi:MAG: excinuclease ABC subunit UvrC [Firmicutes bacterium]|nr:excinuclease ABC subunit UvrC [Bacillota bacterium]
MNITELREKSNKLPLLPGVYIMLDKSGEVLYVGKAKALKNRVSSYFRGEHEGKTHALVSKIADFNVIVAASEFEALVLENSLIKRHKPHYNILLKDDKSYPFLRLDVRSGYPRFSLANRTAKDEARYFGPYGGRSASRDIIETLVKALKLPNCSRRFPRDIGKERPCLNYHLGHCFGWCREEGHQEEYSARIRQAVMILEGQTDELLAGLERQMTEAAEALQFERAAELRDRLRSVETLKNRQMVIAAARADTDAIGFCRDAKCCFTVLHYTDGALSGKDTEFIDEPIEDDAEVISSLLRQYYLLRGAWPKTVLLPMEIEDREPLERLLSEAAGSRVYLEAPQRGDRRRLLEAAMVNAKEECLRETDAYQRRLKTLEWLQKTLNLPKEPSRIEAFDISNTGNFGIVAAMTVFVRGKPLKRDYRKFKVGKGSDEPVTQDDYAAMYEVVFRRFKRYAEGDEKFGALPDLLLIDGGATHAGVAEAALNELGLEVPIFGMVKDDRHRTRALITAGGEEIGISSNPAVFAFIGTIQEETHRFAIEYHRSLRSAAIGSTLDDIPGVGEKRRDELLRAFKTVRAVKGARFEELAAVVPKNTAKAVWEWFHGGEE